MGAPRDFESTSATRPVQVNICPLGLLPELNGLLLFRPKYSAKELACTELCGIITPTLERGVEQSGSSSGS
jgi:hypothetical protein